MFSLSSLIEFLLGLLRDEDARAEFERDPRRCWRGTGPVRRHRPGRPRRAAVLADCDGVSYGRAGGGRRSAAPHGRRALVVRAAIDDDPSA